MIDEYTPLELEVIEKIRKFLKHHDHFSFQIAHIDLEDLNIFGTLGERTLRYVEACLTGDYSQCDIQDTQYLQDCIETLKEGYLYNIKHIDWYTPPTADEWLNDELNALKNFILSIQPDLQRIIDEETI